MIDKPTVNCLPMKSMDDLVEFGKFIAQSGMLGASNDAQGFVVASHCYMKAITPLEFGQQFHIDNRGKVTKRADKMQADFMLLGGSIKWVTESTDRVKQTAEFTFDVNIKMPVTFSFSEAKAAGYIKGGSNWEKDPAAQMRARVITRGVRMVCPAAVAGVYTPDELQDAYGTPSMETKNETEEFTAQIKSAKHIMKVQSDSDFCPIPNCDQFGKKWDELDSSLLYEAVSMIGQFGINQGHVDTINEIIKGRD